MYYTQQSALHNSFSHGHIFYLQAYGMVIRDFCNLETVSYANTVNADCNLLYMCRACFRSLLHCCNTSRSNRSASCIPSADTQSVSEALPTENASILLEIIRQ